MRYLPSLCPATTAPLADKLIAVHPSIKYRFPITTISRRHEKRFGNHGCMLPAKPPAPEARSDQEQVIGSK
jgi:hypothetical protein